MSRQRKETPKSSRSAVQLADLVDTLGSFLTFKPTTEQRLSRACFWERINSETVPIPKEEVNLSHIEQYCLPAEINRMKSWLEVPAFADWFLFKASFDSRVEALADLSLDTLEYILMDTDPKSTAARVNACKVILEMAGKLKKHQQQVFVDEDIQKMTAAQLQQYIQRHTVVETPRSLGTSTTSEEEEPCES